MESTATVAGVSGAPSSGFGMVLNRPVNAPGRVAGAGLLLIAAAVYLLAGGVWWSGLALLFVPDLGAIGFGFGPRIGVAAYNAAHRLPIPASLLAAGLVAGWRPVALAGLIWLGHIGMDRALGYGLKDVQLDGRRS